MGEWVGCLVSWFVGWVGWVCWVVGWWVGRWVGGLVGLVGFVGWLVGWLVGWFVVVVVVAVFVVVAVAVAVVVVVVAVVVVVPVVVVVVVVVISPNDESQWQIQIHGQLLQCVVNGGGWVNHRRFRLITLTKLSNPPYKNNIIYIYIIYISLGISPHK